MVKRVLDMLECWGGGFGRHCTTDIEEIEGEAITFGVQIIVILFYK